MSRLAETFARCRSENRAAFIAYLCAGDPDFDTSLDLCRAALAAGVDILELGVPFTDPLADGLTNQLAAQRALESGMTPPRVADLARRIRSESAAPIVFYTYYNLIFARGVEAALTETAAAGVDGLLVLDLPPEEAEELREVSRRLGLDNIFIIAPTTPVGRMERIAAAASGFLYYVSREGVTGERTELAGGLAGRVEEIRRHSTLPVAVGFGISTPGQVREVAAAADGVIVGSALVNLVPTHRQNPAQLREAMAEKVRWLSAGCRRGPA